MTFTTSLAIPMLSELGELNVNRSLSHPYPVTQFLTRRTLTELYTVYVLPIFDYFDTVFGPQLAFYDANRLE